MEILVVRGCAMLGDVDHSKTKNERKREEEQ